MTSFKNRTPMSIELIEDLIGFITIPDVKNENPIQVGALLDASIAQLKMFFVDHHQNKECEKPFDFEKKVSFWDRFSHHVLSSEMADKPEGMSDDKFLLDVKFSEYAYLAKHELFSCNKW